MALVATESPDLTYEVSAATVRELKLIGINWLLVPSQTSIQTRETWSSVGLNTIPLFSPIDQRP